MTSVHSLESLGVWPDFSASVASLGAAGFGVAGVGTRFFPWPFFDKILTAPKTSSAVDDIPQ